MSGALDPRMLQRALRGRILAELQTKAREDGTHAVSDVRAAARRAGVSERTVYAWLADGLPASDRPRTFIWDPAYDGVLAECRGNVTELHRRLAEAGIEALPSEQWLRKLARARFGKRGLVHLHKGEAASRVHKLRRIIEIPEVNQQWQADLFDFALPVQHEDLPGKWMELWGCTFQDACSRVIVGAAVGVDRDAGLVLSALAAALRSDGVYGPWGGKPELILFDNGSEFLAHPLVSAFVETLDLTIEECYIGSPEGKGKVERLGQTLKHRWADLQPDSTRGPKRNNGDLYPAQRGPNLYERARGLFQAVFEYNTQWPHSKLGGRPPALAWEEKAPQVETFAPEELLALMEAEPAMVGQKGVARFNDHYWAPELHSLVGEPVEIRFVRGDTRQVEVLRDGRWLCSAVPNTERSDEDDDRYSELERAEVRRLNDLVRAANRAPRPRRTRTALTVAGAASPLREPSPEQPLRVSSNAELIALADLAAMRRHRRSA